MKQVYLTSNGTYIKISHFIIKTRIKYKNYMDQFATIKITGLPEDITIVTCVDENNIFNSNSPIIRQLNKNNIPFVNAYTTDINNKTQLISDALKKIKTKYCLILNDTDITINDNLSDIIELFNTYNKKIVFNAAAVCYVHKR